MLQRLLFLWSMGPRAPRLQWWHSVGSGAVAPRLWSTGLMVVVPSLSSSEAPGIFLDQVSCIGRILYHEPLWKPHKLLKWKLVDRK